MSFNPNEHLMQLQRKDYLPVQWRLVWFRDVCPAGTIETKMEYFDPENQMAIFKAIIKDGKGGVGEGYGSETVKDFRDYIEKAETKAIGRALATLGYGTQFAPELEEGTRIVDSPVSKPSQAQGKVNGNGLSHPSAANTHTTPASSDGQEKPLHIRLYEEGKRAELWNKETYYPELGKIVGCPMSKEVFYGLKPDDLAKIERYVAAAADAVAH